MIFQKEKCCTLDKHFLRKISFTVMQNKVSAIYLKAFAERNVTKSKDFFRKHNTFLKLQ